MTMKRPIAENQLVRGPGPTLWYVTEIKPGAKTDFAELQRLMADENGFRETDLKPFPDLKSDRTDWTPVTDRDGDPVLIVATGIDL